ncbi:hypothetical protein Pelo_11521 [Pelomyxa schiedti]|nr:hypothetical protein Pelo_11521 [Pelomyxa schiedti]
MCPQEGELQEECNDWEEEEDEEEEGEGEGCGGTFPLSDALKPIAEVIPNFLGMSSEARVETLRFYNARAEVQKMALARAIAREVAKQEEIRTKRGLAMHRGFLKWSFSTGKPGSSRPDLYGILAENFQTLKKVAKKAHVPICYELRDIHAEMNSIPNRKPDFAFFLSGQPSFGFYSVFFLEIAAQKGGDFPSSKYKGRALDYAIKFLDSMPMRMCVHVAVTNLQEIWCLRVTRRGATNSRRGDLHFCIIQEDYDLAVSGANSCGSVKSVLLKVLNMSEKELTGCYRGDYSFKVPKREHVEDSVAVLQHECDILQAIATKIRGNPSKYIPATEGLTDQRDALILEPIGKSLDDRQFPKHGFLAYFCGLVEALQHVHLEAGIVHRDVCPDNIVFWEGSKERPQSLVLIDWGFAQRLPCNQPFSGTVPWASDEVLKQLLQNQSNGDEMAPVKYTPADDLVSLVRTLLTVLDDNSCTQQKVSKYLQCLPCRDLGMPPDLTSSPSEDNKASSTNLPDRVYHQWYPAALQFARSCQYNELRQLIASISNSFVATYAPPLSTTTTTTTTTDTAAAAAATASASLESSDTTAPPPEPPSTPPTRTMTRHSNLPAPPAPSSTRVLAHTRPTRSRLSTTLTSSALPVRGGFSRTPTRVRRVAFFSRPLNLEQQQNHCT